MYTCKTGRIGNGPLCLFLCVGYVHIEEWESWQCGPLCLCMCWCRGYVHMEDWEFGKNDLCYVCVGVESMYTCKTVHFVNKPLCLCLFLYRI